MTRPNIDKYGSRYGGNDEDFKHMPLRFPSDVERRRVRVYIHSYIGIGIGAIHWYADVEEDDNGYLDHEAKKFRTTWDASELEHMKGKRFTFSCLTKTEAEQRVIELLKEHFPPEDYYVFVSHNDDGSAYEELGYQVQTMYLNKERTMAEATRTRMAAMYKTTEGRGG